MRHSLRRTLLAAMCVMLGTAGCHNADTAIEPQRPDVSPVSQPATGETLQLDASVVKPLHRELLAIDLPSVMRVATADNLDIRKARLEVEAMRGKLESTVGAAFPALVPSALFDRFDGAVRDNEGALVGVGFATFQTAVAVEWMINPGRVIYEILAARKRLAASAHRERAVLLETLRLAAVQYYELVLAQARLAAADQSVAEAEELLRINRVLIETGTGVLADKLRAEARLAGRRQDMLLALKSFYDASVALTFTLHLDDATLTLVPNITQLPPIQLVRDDLNLDDLLGYALVFRPDLKSVRELAEAAAKKRGATWWGAFGPQFEASYQYGGITGRADDVVPLDGLPGTLIVNPLSADGSFAANPLANATIREGIRRGSIAADPNDDQVFSFRSWETFAVGIRSRWSVSAFGDLKSADARQEQAVIDADRQLDRVKAEVVSSLKASQTHRELIGLAAKQVDSAKEALRLSEANLRAGAMTTLDVLQAQDALSVARLRYAEAVVRYNQSEVNLLASIGLLESDALQAESGQVSATPPNDSSTIQIVQPSS